MKSASSPSVRRPAGKPPSISKPSATDWDYLHAADQHGVPDSEHPEASLEHVVQGIVRRGLQPLPAKASVSLRIDQDVLEWFKAQGPGYQTRINRVLRAFRDASISVEY